MAAYAYDVESDGRLPAGSIILACAVREGAEDQPLFFYGQEEAQQFLRSLGPSDLLVGQNLKYDMRATGVIPDCKVLDSLVLSWLYDPSGQHGLKYLSAEVLGQPLEDPIKVREGKVFWRNYQTPIRDADIEEVKRYCLEDTLAALKLARMYEELLDSRTLDWYWQWEEPFIKSLALMESKGLLLDEDKRQHLSTEFQRDLDEARAELFRLVGYEFNTESPPQLGKVLYTKQWEDKERGVVGTFKRCDHSADAIRCRVVDCPGPRPKYGWVPVVRLGQALRPAGRTESGKPATDARALGEHAGHPVVDTLLHVRELQKLLSTYLLAFPEHTHQGRLYGSFNGCGTATGRLSSSEPNLQNIPARGKHGKLIRSLFVPAAGHTLVVADLSAIELRLLAEFSQEPTLLSAFERDGDVHEANAQRVGIDRATAKTFAYGLAYGSGIKKAAQVTGQSVKELRPKWEAFHASIPNVLEWKQQVVETARRHGYVELPSGRRRYLPDLNSFDRERRGYAERQAVNTWPQGTAADLMKCAQVLLLKEGLAGRAATPLVPNAQVHDEFIFECRPEEAEGICRAIEKAVGAAAEVLDIRVPVVVEPKTVDNWGGKG